MTKKYILIIEDNKSQTQIFERVITNIDYKAFSITSGKDALDYLVNNNKSVSDIPVKNISLILLDLSLKDISGFEILKKVRKLKKPIPVMILSANEDLDIIVQSIKLGAENYFIKGKSESELKRMYKAIIEVMEK